VMRCCCGSRPAERCCEANTTAPAAMMRWNGVALMDNGYMAVGRVSNFSGDVDAYVLAVDMNGAELWWQSWGGTKEDVFNGIARSGSNFYLAGRTDSYGPELGAAHVRSSYVLVMDAAGDTLWTRTFGDVAAANSKEGIRAFSNGELLLVGGSGSDHLSNGMSLGVNTSGNKLWQHVYPIDLTTVLHAITFWMMAASLHRVFRSALRATKQCW
ncbi:MAG: hypothetical protein WAT41_13225, partial [Flavobacteriales bacterium]